MQYGIVAQASRRFAGAKSYPDDSRRSLPSGSSFLTCRFSFIQKEHSSEPASRYVDMLFFEISRMLASAFGSLMRLTGVFARDFALKIMPMALS
jgi:hypothetical protein